MTEQPTPDHPIIRWIEQRTYAQITFASADEVVQLREFSNWCAYFGFNEGDRPEKVEGNIWFIRSSMSQT